MRNTRVAVSGNLDIFIATGKQETASQNGGGEKRGFNQPLR
jgi:hypothetical protein